MSNVEEQQNTNIDDIQEAVTVNLDSINPDEHHIPVVKQLTVIFSLLALIFGSSYIPDVLTAIDAKESTRQTLPAQTPSPIISPEDTEKVEVDPFADIDITAASAYVWDVKAQKALYNKNADAQLPLASVTKLMTGLVAFELLGDEITVDITREAVYQDGDSGLLDGESFSMKNLLDLTLMTSSNDGAYALAAAGGASLGIDDSSARTFVEAMNIRAEEIGLSQTFFRNPTGLDITEEEAGAYGSARDVAFLMEYIVTNYPEVLEFTTEEAARVSNEAGAYHELENTNQSVSEIPGLIGSKTGYTALAGGNLVIAFNAGLNRPIIVTVLGSTYSGRFADVAALSQAATALIHESQ